MFATCFFISKFKKNNNLDIVLYFQLFFISVPSIFSNNAEKKEVKMIKICFRNCFLVEHVFLFLCYKDRKLFLRIDNKQTCISSWFLKILNIFILYDEFEPKLSYYVMG